MYGDIILIRPNIAPCSTRFVQWATVLPLQGENTIPLVGPFDFEPINSTNIVRNGVSTNN